MSSMEFDVTDSDNRIIGYGRLENGNNIYWNKDIRVLVGWGGEG